jgi:hypothetical protein
MTTYKTLDGQDYTIPGVGRTVDGQITTDQTIESPLLVEVKEGEPVYDPQEKPAPFDGTASQQNPAQPEAIGEPVINLGEQA